MPTPAGTTITAFICCDVRWLSHVHTGASSDVYTHHRSRWEERRRCAARSSPRCLRCRDLQRGGRAGYLHPKLAGLPFDHFIGQLQKHGRAGAWRFSPGQLKLRSGGSLLVTNRGGEDHTCTEVANFGGGCVPQLNAILGLTPVPECAVPGLFDSTLIEQGATLRVTGLTPGVYRFECLIHPWMRTTVTVGLSVKTPGGSRGCEPPESGRCLLACIGLQGVPLDASAIVVNSAVSIAIPWAPELIDNQQSGLDSAGRRQDGHGSLLLVARSSVLPGRCRDWVGVHVGSWS